MPIYNLTIIDSASLRLLYSHYFMDRSLSIEQKTQYESLLLERLQVCGVTNITQQQQQQHCFSLSYGSPSTQHYVYAISLGSLLLLMTGCGDTDETMLAEYSAAVTNCLVNTIAAEYNINR
jgi:hypothetical protein